MKQNYSKFTREELEEKVKELQLRIMRSHSGVGKAKEDPRNRKKLRKEIARIKTELNKRK